MHTFGKNSEQRVFTKLQAWHDSTNSSRPFIRQVYSVRCYPSSKLYPHGMRDPWMLKATFDNMRVKRALHAQACEQTLKV